MTKVLAIQKLGFVLCLAAALLASALYAPMPASAQQRVEISDPEALLEFFESINYTPEAWQAGIRDVPRAYIMKIGPKWQINSQNIAVINKKRIFFRALGPLVLRANEMVLADREHLLAIIETGKPSGNDTVWLRELAAEYGVTESVEMEPAAEQLDELLRRVDGVPVSLLLAQGAEESGWGTSRFAAEGNALFGQWTWGGKGIKPKDQREELGDYRIAAFDTPLESVSAYLHNINTHPAYVDLRSQRALMRQSGELLSGWKLAETLTQYSERGADYVGSLHAIMRVNKLEATDEAKLLDGEEWHLYPTQQ